MGSFRQLIGEIHRRSLWQVLGIYAVASWVIYQIVLALWEGLGLPEWVPGTALVLLLIGLPVVLATAFVQEGRPGSGAGGGRESAGQVSEAPGWAHAGGHAPSAIARKAFTWRVALMGGVAAFALLALGAAGAMVLADGDNAEDRAGAIAVLPFDNMSPDPDDAFFTDGVHEEILSELAMIGGLRVISRTSVMEYRQRTRNLTDIAGALGARYVLEGSVRRFADRVRITAQLIDARSDEHLWAQTYERERTDLFAIQSQVAGQIAATLAAELSPAEQARMEVAPTMSADAHDLYLRANRAVMEGYRAPFDERAERWGAALRQYDLAATSDSAFADALGASAVHRCRMSWYGHDMGPHNERLARMALDQAQRHGSGPALDMAEGMYWYWCRRDYDRALTALRRAGRAYPPFDNISAPGMTAFVLRRQGHFQEALDRLSEVVALDPLNANLLENAGWLAAIVGDYDSARGFLERAHALDPDVPTTKGYLGYLVFFETGDPRRMRDVLDGFGSELDLILPRLESRLLQRDYDGAMALLDTVPSGTMIDDQAEFWTAGLLKAMVHHQREEDGQARALFEEARELLAGALAAATDRTERISTTLALAEAGLGLRDQAVARARRAAEGLPPSLDAWAAFHYQRNLAWTLILVGDHEAALDELAFLMQSPRHPPATWLRADYRWEPVRDSSRFMALLEQ